MARESASGDTSGTGSSGDATDSRPISVSELLARSRDAGGPAVTPRDGRGRRRVGREGTVSVSELTGEIPRVETGPFPRATNPVARRHSEDAPVAESPSGPQRRAAASAGPSTASGMPTYATPPATRDFSSQAVSQRIGAAAAADRAGRGEDVDDESANAVTGIIPIVEDQRDDLVVVEPDDIEGVDLARAPATASPDPRWDDGSTVPPAGSAEENKDFDAYRNFSDVDHEEQPARKRRFFDRFRKKPTPAAPSRAEAARERAGATEESSAPADTTPADTTPADTTPTDTAPLAPSAAAVTAATVSDPIGHDADLIDEPSAAITPHVDERTDSGDDAAITPHLTAAEPVEQAHAESADPESYAVATDAEEADAGGVVAGDAGPEEIVAEEIVADELGADELGAGELGAGELGAAEADGDTDGADGALVDEVSAPELAVDEVDAVVEDDAVTPPGDTDPTLTGPPTASSFGERAPGEATPAEATAAQPTTAAEKSPGLAWLMILGESLAGLAIGVGLFWGFTELWKWNVYFALILAVLVIFGIVTFTHLVRHSRDLVTTLLALAVGLIVTIGPLVLLAT